ncbi:ankyrin repeat and MYND domain-containing protein 1-like isoform X4 [Phycodurus eques]|uniref:ankyrin repeat and MYND domain-containing protein 1-like isoform X4 n=1 Tax=Phycodurus eques TaxID=693459 RepID=UPI002ACEB4CE|nr:ankyrin repeat and MYND domain-containing protein 1-like isoform X4 [Phycodurus eques]
MLSNCPAVVTAPGRVATKPRPAGSPNIGVGEVRRQMFGVQEFLDGSKYEGDFVHGLKHGKGRYTWKSGEFYEGSFYKDYRHGDGIYCWPTGNKFIGKFYLNWREGYGKHIFADGATFKGLYHADQRFGPGVLSEPTGCQDVGLWYGKHLMQMCNTVQGSFSLKNVTEYAAYLEETIFSHSQSQVDTDESWLLPDRNNAIPCGIESYSTDGDHLPLPPGRRRELDEQFYGQQWEPDSHAYEGYKRNPYTSLPLQARMLAHIHKHRHRVRLTTLNLLLDRGADPNTSRIPLPVILLAILAADTKTVRKHLLCGAQTDISLPPERKGLYPLHVAAALPGLEGPEITKLLLHALTDPDARACDQDDVYEPDQGSTITRKSWKLSEKPRPKEGGRTALHIACQRDSDYCNASKVVSLLLSYKASTDLLWSGHSPLSLAIASGNNTAVEELLKGGVDPNLPLGRGVGSALCTLGNFNYRLDANRPKLLDMLEKVGADILMPVQVGDSIGTAVDYAHISFNQDSGIAHTPYHALSLGQRETFRIQRQLLSMMGSLLKKSVVQREREYQGREECLVQSDKGAISYDAKSINQSEPPIGVKRRSPFRFCYHCGRSAAVKLTACTRCHKVFYCSMACKLIAWDERHKEECLRETGAVPITFEKRVMFQAKKGPKTVLFASRRPFHVQFKSQVLVIEDNIAEWQSINLKENYSYN